MAWEEATEGERGLSGGSDWGWSCRNGMGRCYGGGARFERSLRVTGAGAAEATEGERGLRSCRNGMGRGYGGGARLERSLRVTGAGAEEMAWEEATEGERGLSGR